MKNALIVFAKVPEPGRVKTRLVPFLSPDEAAALYDAFLRDALDQYDDLGVDVRVYVAGEEGERMQDIHPNTYPQRGEGLGERMLMAFAETFATGYTRAVIVGTDHPTLPASFLVKAFKELETPRRVVIGPAEDGGYYLLGMNDLRPRLFRGMSYSHERVFDEAVERVIEEEAGLSVLPPWYDVDTPQALGRLAEDLESTHQAPRTRELLSAWLERLGTTGEGRKTGSDREA